MLTAVSFVTELIPYVPFLGSLLSILLTLPALRLVETCGRKALLINTLVFCAIANYMLCGFTLVSENFGSITTCGSGY